MPTFIVGTALAEGKLQAVLEDFALPEHSIYAVFPERKHVPAKVRVFIEFLQQRLARE